MLLECSNGVNRLTYIVEDEQNLALSVRSSCQRSNSSSLSEKRSRAGSDEGRFEGRRSGTSEPGGSRAEEYHCERRVKSVELLRRALERNEAEQQQDKRSWLLSLVVRELM